MEQTKIQLETELTRLPELKFCLPQTTNQNLPDAQTDLTNFKETNNRLIDNCQYFLLQYWINKLDRRGSAARITERRMRPIMGVPMMNLFIHFSML